MPTWKVWVELLPWLLNIILWIWIYWATFVRKNVLPLLRVPVRICNPCGFWTMLFIMCCSSVSTISPILISNTWSLCFGACLIFTLAWSNNGIETWMSCGMCSRSSMDGLPKVAQTVAIISVFMRLQCAHSNKYFWMVSKFKMIPRLWHSYIWLFFFVYGREKIIFIPKGNGIEEDIEKINLWTVRWVEVCKPCDFIDLI